MSKTAEEMNITAVEVAWVFKMLSENMREGGTFRKLIYDRMGFAKNSYQILYESGGMYLTNLVENPEIDPEIFLKQIAKMMEDLKASEGLDSIMIVEEMKEFVRKSIYEST